ncbi:alpha-N-acetylgalactosaminide alpha-2,6-sialyltransferase 2-like [Antedon mediterranea]|uniref:alpha-N-acetylgalactosaminide alpha-2,6-sialyltransferase 2-like n=1 Tax=Antedon mediterranea TaxID=105859 RepID=UPI003AF45505
MSWGRLYQRFICVCIISILLCFFIVYQLQPNPSANSSNKGEVDSLLIREIEYDRPPKEDVKEYDRPPKEDVAEYDRPPKEDVVEYDKPPKEDVVEHDKPPKEDVNITSNRSNREKPIKNKPELLRPQQFGKMVHFATNDSMFDFRTKIDFKPTTCPNSIQKKLQQSKWASEMFLPNITMAMHEGAMSEEEYNRLHAFGMPFGLSFRDDLLYSDLQAILSKLPRVDSILDFSGKERPSCLSCAVVGNGGILNGSKLGKEIDEHDLVFRVNHAIRRGFEEDVGTKTTHYVMMDRSLAHTSKEDVPRDKGIKYVFLPCRRKDYNYINTVIGPPDPKRQLVADAKDLRILHPDFVRYIHRVWMKVRAFRPTTGGMMFMSALHAGCDSLDVYGMGYTRQYSDHYYDLTYIPFKAFLGSHDYRREIKLMKMLDDDGIINWYKRDVKEFL